MRPVAMDEDVGLGLTARDLADGLRGTYEGTATYQTAHGFGGSVRISVNVLATERAELEDRGGGRCVDLLRVHAEVAYCTDDGNFDEATTEGELIWIGDGTPYIRAAIPPDQTQGTWVAALEEEDWEQHDLELILRPLEDTNGTEMASNGCLQVGKKSSGKQRATGPLVVRESAYRRAAMWSYTILEHD